MTTLPVASPWIHQLQEERVRPVATLQGNEQADVVIVGGGIAGAATAAQLLRQLPQARVVLLEGGYIGHGASGHNAGQAVPYFEKPFAEIVAEYGAELAIAGQQAVVDQLDVLRQLAEQVGVDAYFFDGYAALGTVEQLREHLANAQARRAHGLQLEHIYVPTGSPLLAQLPAADAALCEERPIPELEQMIGSPLDGFVAVLQTRKGVVNSAIFSEKLVHHLLRQHGDRFAVYEKTLVRTVRLKRGHALVQCNSGTVQAGHVVLCTNGFEKLKIVHDAGADVHGGFREKVYGVVGYMSALKLPEQQAPTAVSYFAGQKDAVGEDIYTYVTKRPWQGGTLMALGGPEELHPEGRMHRPGSPYPKWARRDINDFLEKHGTPTHHYAYEWHGLMGYTSSYLRIAGPEPRNGALVYNLGCNGVGILASLWGAQLVAQYVATGVAPRTIFDPAVQQAVKR